VWGLEGGQGRGLRSGGRKQLSICTPATGALTYPHPTPTPKQSSRRSQLRMQAGIELEGAEYRGRRSTRAQLFGGDDGFEAASEEGEEEEEDDDDEQGLLQQQQQQHKHANGGLTNGVHHSSDSEEEGEEEEEGGESDEPEEAGVHQNDGAVEGLDGDSDDDEEEEEEQEEDMITQLQRYQTDPEMEELER